MFCPGNGALCHPVSWPHTVLSGASARTGQVPTAAQCGFYIKHATRVNYIAAARRASHASLTIRQISRIAR